MKFIGLNQKAGWVWLDQFGWLVRLEMHAVFLRTVNEVRGPELIQKSNTWKTMEKNMQPNPAASKDSERKDCVLKETSRFQHRLRAIGCINPHHRMHKTHVIQHRRSFRKDLHSGTNGA